MSEHTEEKGYTPAAPLTYSITQKSAFRKAVSLFYFCQGLAFASWASRIPDIKTEMGLSEAQLGTALLALPIGQLITMPISGRLVTQYGSKSILTIAAPLYATVLACIGLATNFWQLMGILMVFGIAGNLCNISVNTQGIAVEKIYDKSIMTTFHGAWSIAGFTGALIGLLMMHFEWSPFYHFILITGLIYLNTGLFNAQLVGGIKAPKSKGGWAMKPDQLLWQLGFVGFCSMAAEGAMFDWSGVYFKEVVHAPSSLVVLGYASFMVMMAMGRFMGDWMIRRIGRVTVLQISGIMIAAGMGISVFFPYMVSATLGFMLVGLGVSCIVPSVYSAAGKHSTIPPGVALAMVSSISFLGFLIGPPLIGYIAEMANLQYSYALIGLLGFLITVFVTRLTAFKA
jgi:MFS family permease